MYTFFLEKSDFCRLQKTDASTSKNQMKNASDEVER